MLLLKSKNHSNYKHSHQQLLLILQLGNDSKKKINRLLHQLRCRPFVISTNKQLKLTKHDETSKKLIDTLPSNVHPISHKKTYQWVIKKKRVKNVRHTKGNTPTRYKVLKITHKQQTLNYFLLFMFILRDSATDQGSKVLYWVHISTN